MHKLKQLIANSRAASAAEYALILAIIGSAIALASITLGNSVSNSMNRQATVISDCQDGVC